MRRMESQINPQNHNNLFELSMCLLPTKRQICRISVLISCWRLIDGWILVRCHLMLLQLSVRGKTVVAWAFVSSIFCQQAFFVVVGIFTFHISHFTFLIHTFHFLTTTTSSQCGTYLSSVLAQFQNASHN